MTAACAAASLCAWNNSAHAIITAPQPDGSFAFINDVIGATTFYNHGYFGQLSAVANIEAGLVWDGHESTSQKPITYIYDPSTFQTVPGQLEFDWHATAVGMTLAGLGPPVTLPDAPGQTFFFVHQLGIAPAATLFSGGIATSFTPLTGQFDTTPQAFRYAYQTIDQQTLFRGINGNLVISSGPDVINSSWGFTDPTGSAQYTRLLDAITYTYKNTVVVAAGNSNDPAFPPGGDNPVSLVGGPASGFNVISVGALQQSDPSSSVFDTVADFSSRGPNDFFNPQTGVTIKGVRASVDIVAPGTNLFLAAYLGPTGDRTGVTDPTIVQPPPYPTDLYYVGLSGTSFASPIVAGGASLIADAGWQNFAGGPSIDGRTIKAVLLNSARKIPGWSNNLALGNDPLHPNVLTTTQSLDYASGAGALDLTTAYTQYLGGTTDVPGTAITSPVSVQPVGWDFATVSPANPNDYVISTPLHAGDTLAATLDWFIQESFTDNTPTDPAQQNVATDIAFFNLDLQIWEMIDGVPVLIAQSDSLYNNVEHLYFNVPTDGTYFVRVLWAGTIYDIPGNTPQIETYAVAWADTPIPEPTSLLLLAAGATSLLTRRRWKS